MGVCDDCGTPFCEWCGQEYAEGGAGCPERAIEVRADGSSRWLERIVCGGRRDFYSDGFAPDVERLCSDCGVAEFELHHIGCDRETCPACGGQFLGCECDWRLSSELSPPGHGGAP